MAGMSKREAAKLVDKGGITWDALRVLLEEASTHDLSQQSRVNRQTTRAVSHRVFLAAIAERTGPVCVWRPDPRRRRSGAMKRTTESLIAEKILRDFGAPRGGEEGE